MKMGKKTWIILLIGALVVGGASLGLTLNQQTTQKNDIQKQLTSAKAKLTALDNEKLIVQKESLNLKISDYAAQHKEIEAKLYFPDDNINITDSLIQDALECDVDLLELSSPGLGSGSLAGVQFETMDMSVKAQGTSSNIANFVYSLKKVFPTCEIQNVALSFVDPEIIPTPTPIQTPAGTPTGTPSATPSATPVVLPPPVAIDLATFKDTIVDINFIIYNYKGE
jgi:hypothetical protein